MSQSRPSGLRVVELATPRRLVCGHHPRYWCGGDQSRTTHRRSHSPVALRRNGMSLWYHSLARNKSVTLISNQSAVANWPLTGWQKPTLLSKTSDRGPWKAGVWAQTGKSEEPRHYLCSNIGLRADRPVLREARLRIRYRGLWRFSLYQRRTR